MKQGKLTIGATGCEKRKVSIEEAESVDELVLQAQQNDQVIIRWANRGRRIELQERSGARDWLKEHQALSADEQVAELTKIVHGYDPTAVKERKARARKPKTVTLPKNKVKYSKEELADLLAAHGITVADETEPAATT